MRLVELDRATDAPWATQTAHRERRSQVRSTLIGTAFESTPIGVLLEGLCERQRSLAAVFLVHRRVGLRAEIKRLGLA